VSDIFHFKNSARDPGDKLSSENIAHSPPFYCPSYIFDYGRDPRVRSWKASNLCLITFVESGCNKHSASRNLNSQLHFLEIGLFILNIISTAPRMNHSGINVPSR